MIYLYYVMIAFIFFLIIGNIFFQENKFYQRFHFVSFLILNLMVLLRFVLQNIYSSRQLMVLAFDEIKNVIPDYFSSNLTVIALQMAFNLIYVVLLIKRRLEHRFI
ncbi:MAG: hypothetical protein A4E59_00252 [Syntrophorhabdus sp. PtaB.Bin027]|nr:MAG: hypothetical protein A4E59_00252 [Syntrophorhabdus sp. PtaB.Bin027]